MLIECVNCGFYVSSSENLCPNCGLFAPGEELQKNSEYYKRDLTVTIAIAFAIVSSLIVLYIRSDGKFDNLSELPFLLLGSLLLGLAFSVIFSSIITKRMARNEVSSRFPDLKTGATFMAVTDTIAMRKFELDRKYHETEKLIERAEKSGSQTTADKLLAARDLILAQISRYELQDEKITLIRLQNNLRPILYHQNFSDAETEIFAENIEEAILEIRDMRESLINPYAIEFPEAVQAEKENFLAQLNETEKSCERLRETLLSHQAVRALRDVSPIRENSYFSNEQEIDRRTEIFNIQTMLTDFSASFNKLEREYKRLAAEKEIEQKFLGN